MTVPFAIMAAMTIASTAASIAGQAQAARQQASYQNRVAEAANKALLNTYETMQHQRIQEREATSTELENAAREGLAARGTLRTAAGEAGVSGLSVDALTKDFMARELNFATNTKENYARKSDQIGREMEGARSGAASQINQVWQPIQRPNYLGEGLKMGASLFGAYDRYVEPLSIGGSKPKN